MPTDLLPQLWRLGMQVGMKQGRLYAFRARGTAVVAHPVVRVVGPAQAVLDETSVAVFVQPKSRPGRIVVVTPRLMVFQIPELLRFKYALPHEAEAYWGLELRGGTTAEGLTFPMTEAQASVPLREIALYPGIVFKLLE